MNKNFSKTVFSAVLAILLAGCSGDWCKTKAASSTTNTTPSNSGANVTAGTATQADNVVFFDFDSTKIHEDGKAVIKAHQSKDNLIVTGHCSEEGSEAYNNGLGERRGHAVVAELGKDAKVVSYGKSADFNQGLEKNRRAIIHSGEIKGVEGKPAEKATKKAAKVRSKKVSKKAKAVKSEAAKAEVATPETAKA